jgi:hypothetical protein
VASKNSLSPTWADRLSGAEAVAALGAGVGDGVGDGVVVGALVVVVLSLPPPQAASINGNKQTAIRIMDCI